jgi:hypothetical protein
MIKKLRLVGDALTCLADADKTRYLCFPHRLESRRKSAVIIIDERFAQSRGALLRGPALGRPFGPNPCIRADRRPPVPTLHC